MRKLLSAIPHKFWYFSALGIVLNGLFLAFLLLGPTRISSFTTLDDFLNGAGWLVGAALCFGTLRCPRRNQATAQAQHPLSSSQWTALLIGIGIVLNSCAQFVATYYDTINKYLFPSYGDLLFLSAYPFFILGILLLPTQTFTGIARSRTLLDSFVLIIALVAFSWYFLLGPNLLEANTTLAAKLVGTAYPFFDLIMISSLLLVSARVKQRGFRLAVAVLSLGMFLNIIADTLFGYSELQSTYTTGQFLELGYMLGFFLIGMAMQIMQVRSNASIPSPAQQAGQHRPNTPLWQALLPYALLPAILGLVIYVAQSGIHGPLTYGVYIICAILLGVIVLRQSVAIRESYQLNRALSEANERLEALATTDPLTDLPNHRAVVEALDKELQRTQRYHRRCSMLFVDIDHFKAINDGYGHPAGDDILRQFAFLVRSSLREIDTVGRWGGEEFVAILPEVDIDETVAIAERIRSRVARHLFPIGGGLHITCSIGLANIPEDSQERDSIIQKADQAMYAAKKLGRNQVCRADDPLVQMMVNQEELHGSSEEMAMLQVVEALSVLVEARDHYTGKHGKSVANETMQLAHTLHMDEKEVRMLGIAAQLHDLGKVAVPDAILLKPDKLSADEWVTIRKHPEVGAAVLARIPALRSIASIVHAHHERWDGTGYPQQLASEDIPLGARIIAVIDAFHAMTTDRPYQQARSVQEALRELQRNAGSQFDPAVVEALIQMLAKSGKRVAA